MHFDTRLFLVYLIIIRNLVCVCQYSDEQSYLSLVEFNRGGPLTNVVLSSPHGGFLGGDLLSKTTGKTLSKAKSVEPLTPLPIGGCYNHTLDRCVYTLRDCLRSDGDDFDRQLFYPDARCVTDRSSTSTMYLLTKAIADSFLPPYRPYTILNKLTRQYVDPAEDLLAGTFLLESATRIYMDYHRLIAMSKESIRPPSYGIFIEFVFHKNSQTVQLGYGFEPNLSLMLNRPQQSTITPLLSRSGPSAIKGNNSFGYFLHRNGFEHVSPFNHQKTMQYRISTHSTRMHADQRFSAILFSYPIERLRTHTLKQEAIRIANSIEQFISSNKIRYSSSSALLSPLYTSSITILVLCLVQLFLMFQYINDT